MDRFDVSQRRACRVLRQPRATQRYTAQVCDDEVPLTCRIIELASVYGRYGYRRITALLRREGWWVNHKRVERIWRREGLKVPKKQPRRGRLWMNDGSCIPAEADAQGPCVELRLRARPDARWPELPDVSDHRRVYAGVPGD